MIEGEDEAVIHSLADEIAGSIQKSLGQG